MPQKIFFFPGFVQDARAFEALMLSLQDEFELVGVDYLPVFPFVETKTADIRDFSKRLVDLYQIEESDLLVGHSFGGWVAANVQQFTGSPVLQLASFTNPRKPVVVRLGLQAVGELLMRMGAFKWRIVQYVGRFRHRNTAAYPAVLNALEVMKNWQDEDLIKVTRLIVNQPAVIPKGKLLRIHSDRDEVVFPPDETHICLPDATHAIHVSHAGMLASIIKNWIVSGYNWI